MSAGKQTSSKSIGLSSANEKNMSDMCGGILYFARAALKSLNILNSRTACLSPSNLLECVSSSQRWRWFTTHCLGALIPSLCSLLMSVIMASSLNLDKMNIQCDRVSLQICTQTPMVQADAHTILALIQPLVMLCSFAITMLDCKQGKPQAQPHAPVLTF